LVTSPGGFVDFKPTSDTAYWIASFGRGLQVNATGKRLGVIRAMRDHFSPGSQEEKDSDLHEPSAYRTSAKDYARLKEKTHAALSKAFVEGQCKLSDVVVARFFNTDASFGLFEKKHDVFEPFNAITKPNRLKSYTKGSVCVKDAQDRFSRRQVTAGDVDMAYDVGAVFRREQRGEYGFNRTGEGLNLENLQLSSEGKECPKEPKRSAVQDHAGEEDHEGEEDVVGYDADED
jgi:hypothetical protein